MFWRWPGRPWLRGACCSTSSSRNWRAASPRIQSASVRCASRCRTSATTCSLLPACSTRNLIAIAHDPCDIAEPLVREACLLHRLSSTSVCVLAGLEPASREAGRQVPHVVRGRQPGDGANTAQQFAGGEPELTAYAITSHCGVNWAISYLDLLQFYLNHHRFTRSRCAERQGKSPREVMTGQSHPHWLTLLGLGPLQPQRA